MTSLQKSFASFVFLFVMLAFAYIQTQAPAADPDSDLDYAALRQHVSFIAAKPHPMGSAANREVRDYIVRYFESLGLATQVQKTTVVYRHPSRPNNATIIANVENIIARLPGTSSAPDGQANDLVLMGHYDSRPDGPGAADDASGTASIMEVARIMAAGPAPAHDVVFLITDGEEMGLLGAQGFYRQHPAAKNVGLVLDFEARGSYGASSMFETSDNNAWLIDELIQSAPDLVAGSLSYEIYRRMPNDTDMSISKGEGIPGLNFAFVSGLFDYHSMTDTVENLDPDTLAQQANYALATARHFANIKSWDAASGDKTYFNLWQGRLVSYGQSVAVAIGMAVLMLGLWVFVVALRGGKTSWGSLGSGVLSLMILIALIGNIFASMIDYQQTADAGITRLISLGEWPLLAYFVTVLGLTVWFGHALKRGMSTIEVLAPPLLVAVLSMLAGRPWFVTVFILALIPLMLLIRSRKSTPDLWSAALILWWLLTAFVLYFAPNASYIFVLPLASVLLGRAVKGNDQFASALVASIIPLLLLAPVIVMGYLALGSTLPQGLMILTALVLLLIWPLVQNLGFLANGKFGQVLLAAGLVMTLVVMFGRGFDARHPRGEELFYAIDVDQQQGFWVSSDARPGSWLESFLGNDAYAANITRILPGYDQDVLIRETAVPTINAATLEVYADRMIDGSRELGMHLHSPVAAAYINLLFPNDAGISKVLVNGLPVAVPEPATGVEETAEPGWWRWRWYGLPEQGGDIVITLDLARPLTVKLVEVDYELPADAPRRPENSMHKKYSWSDATVIFQTLELE